MIVLTRDDKLLLLRLLIGIQFPGNVRSKLHKISSNFNPEIAPIEDSIDTFAVIGDVETCAVELIRTKWNPDLMMSEFAELSYSIIRYIEERNISAAVGLGPHRPPVRYLSDLGNTDTELTDNEWRQFRDA
jgi:hypothetical protein